MQDFMQLIWTVLPLMVAAALGWLAQWVVPRVRKAKDRADAAKATADAAKAGTDALDARFEFYEERLNWCFARISTLERRVGKMEGAINAEPPDVRGRIWARIAENGDHTNVGGGK